MEHLDIGTLRGVAALAEDESIATNGGYRHGSWDKVVHDIKITMDNHIAIANNYAILIAYIINSPNASIVQGVVQGAHAHA